jgi:hypothetical protein
MAGITDLVINIKANDKATGQLDKTAKGIDKVGKSAGIASNAIKAMGVALVSYLSVRSITALINAFEKQEMSVAALENALAGAGYEAKVFSGELQKLSAELQKNSVYGDEDLNIMQAKLLTYGNTISKVKELMPLLVELASKMSLNAGRVVSLQEAYTLYISALNGMERPLRQYGLNLDKTILLSKDADAITKELTKSTKGATDALNDTSLGKRTQFANAVSDLQEAMGQFIAKSPLFTRVLENLKFYFEYFTPKEKSPLSDLIKDLKETASNLPALNNEWTALKNSVQDVSEEWGTKLVLAKVKELESATGELNNRWDHSKIKLSALRQGLEVLYNAENVVNTVTKENTEIQKENTETTTKSTEEVIRQAGAYKDLAGAIEQLPMAFEEGVAGMSQASYELKESLLPLAEISGILSNNLTEVFFGDISLGESLKNAGKQLLAMLIRLAIQATIVKFLINSIFNPLGNLLGLGGGGTAAAVGGSAPLGSAGGVGGALLNSAPIGNTVPMMSGGGTTIVYNAPLPVASNREIVKDVMKLIDTQQRINRRYTL